MNTNRPFFCIMGTLLACLVANASTNAADHVRWRPTLDQAKVEAAQTGKPVLIHFWTPSCGPCRVLDNDVFSQPQVGETIERYFIPVKINADVASALASSFGLDRVPSEVILTPQGSVLANLSCPLNAQAYLAQLTNFAEHYQAQTSRQVNPSLAPQQAAYGGADPRQFAATNPLNATAQHPVMPTTSGTLGAASGETINPYGRMSSPEQSHTDFRPPTPGDHSQTPDVNLGAQPPQLPGNAMPNSYRHVSGQTAPAAEAAATAHAVAAQVVNHPHSPPHAAPVQNHFVSQQQSKATPPSAIELPPGAPPLAFDGYCPVSLRTTNKWVKGTTAYGAIHRGRTYLLASESLREQFLAAPDSYSPVFSGMDPVLLLDEGTTIEGSRKHGFEYRGAFYLFSGAETMNKFRAQPDKYAAGVRQAMNRLDSPGGETIRR